MIAKTYFGVKFADKSCQDFELEGFEKMKFFKYNSLHTAKQQLMKVGFF